MPGTAGKHGGAIAATAVIPTIKKTNASHVITQTIDRHRLLAAATPQAFQLTILQDAFTRCMLSGIDLTTLTDDSQIVELAGGHVVCVDSNPENIKLTTPFDWQIARACGPEWL
jgi:2-C-methyl-D-erythritol 4-phosphate cytidylyltransferase